MTRQARIIDGALALVALAAVELTCWLSTGVSAHDRLVTAVAAIPFAAPIALRRVSPSAALAVCAATVPASMLLGGQLLDDDNAYMVPVLVLAYSAGACLDRRRSAGSAVFALVLLWAWALLPSPGGSTPGVSPAGLALFYVTMLVVPLWLAGRFARRQRHRTSAFGALALEAAAARHAADAAAVAAERARISAELEDVIAHGLSTMVVQAGSARLTLRSDPAEARRSILSVEDWGRQALDDLRRLLGMLRKDDDPVALGPPSGVDELPALVGALSSRGMACAYHVAGEPVELNPGVGLVAYRMAETSLGAAADHGARRGSITVRYRPRAIEIEIEADVDLEAVQGSLTALVPRLALYDGVVRAQATTEGSLVAARLPLASSAPE